MARHRGKRRYRGLGALVQVPGLGMFKGSVPLGSIVLGTLVGFGTAVALKALVTKVDALKANVPMVVQNNMTLVGGGLGAVVLYFLGRRSPEKAKGRAFGAVFGTATAWGWDMLRTYQKDTFGDIVALNYSNMSRYGYLVNEPRSSYAGLLVDESRRNLAELSAADYAEESPEGDIP